MAEKVKDKSKTKYETLIAIDPTLEKEKRDKVLEELKGVIEKNKGKIVKLDEWGIRKFAYKVKNLNEGFYVVLTYEGNGSTVDEVKRSVRLNSKIVRHMTISLNKK